MKSRLVNRVVAPTALALSIFLPAELVLAASPVAEEGRTLATEWCSGCHMVEPGAKPTTTDAAPAFPEMANDPAYDEDRLRSWLWAPHPPMPDLDLSRNEIELLVQYIRSLGSN